LFDGKLPTFLGFDRGPITAEQLGVGSVITTLGALPSEFVFWLYSLQGVGTSPPIAALGGMTLDLAGSLAVLGWGQAGADGVARFTMPVPL